MISVAMSDHFTRNLSDLLRQNRPPAIIFRVPLYYYMAYTGTDP